MGQTKYFFYQGKKKIFKTVKFFIAETEEKHIRISYEHRGFEWVKFEEAGKKLKFKDLVNLSEKATEYIRRYDEMKKLNKDYSELPGRSKDWNLSSRLVPGEGRLDAEVMLLGQAPGKNEDIQLRPFIGRSGMLLSGLLKAVKIRRSSVYITSTVQFFPPENRMPTPTEVELCKPFLKRQIEIIKPKYIILLGNAAASAMLEMSEVNKHHGKFVEKEGIRYFITFHPAAALRFKKNHELMKNDFENFKKTISNNIKIPQS